MLRTAIYARVSTEEQASAGHSIPAQLAALREHARQHGLEVVGEYVDEGRSARTDGRPEFQRMIAAARTRPRPFDLILIHKGDRFARNREDAVIYKSLLRRECGVEVRSLLEPIDDTPTGKLLEGILEVLAEFYSLNLAQEVLKGQRQQALRGKSVGAAPIGYRKRSDGRYEPDPAAAPMVRWIFAGYAGGTEGMRSIALTLARKGESMFGPVARQYSWTAAAVRRILTNPVYTGDYIWNRRDKARGYRLRDRTEWVIAANAHEPLVGPDTFAQVQRLMRSRRGVTRARPGRDYLLRGLVRCLDCGASMVQYRYQWDAGGQRRVQPSLLCSRYSRHGKCYHNRVPLDTVEEAVRAYLRSLLRGRVDPTRIEIRVQRQDRTRGEAEQVRRQLALLEQRVERLLAAYEGGAITLDDLRLRRAQLDAEQTALQTRAAELLAAAAAPDAPDRRTAEIRERLQVMLEKATDDALEPAIRRRALEQVIDHISVSRRQGALRLAVRLRGPGAGAG